MINFLIAGDIVMITTFVMRLKTLPPQIPLFYSLTGGESQLADTWMIVLLPLLLNLIFILNNYVYNKFFFGNFLAKKLFEYADLFFIIGFTFVFVKIIFLIS